MTTNDNLRAGFAIHTTETERQVELVEEAFEALGMEPTRRDSRVTDGLLEDKEQFDASVTDDELRNLQYLAVGLKTERIEITTYEGLLAVAKKAGLRDDVTDPLEDTSNKKRRPSGSSKGSQERRT